MTGKELIEWIKENNAEDLECIIQYRDGGGLYNGGELMEHPSKAHFELDADGHPYDVDISYIYDLSVNCIVF